MNDFLARKSTSDDIAKFRRGLYVLTIISLIVGSIVLVYSVWIIGEALFEGGVTRSDMLSYGLFYVWAIVIPIEFILAFRLWWQMCRFKRMRIACGVHDREPVEKVAILSIILCLVPLVVAGGVFLVVVITNAIDNVRK